MSLAREKMAWVEEITGKFAFTDMFAKYTEIVGLTIKEVVLVEMNDTLAIHFTDGRILMIRDDGQSCCESRYMTCDDDLTGHAGGHLISVDLNASAMGTINDPEPPEEDSWGSEYHEEQFVRVQTSKGSFTLCTHNEHNGYYGGFSLSMTLEA